MERETGVPAGIMMDTRTKSTAVHIWRIEFYGKELRTTSPDGLHTWIAWEDFVEAAQIQDPIQALTQIDRADVAELSPGKYSEEVESLRLINEIAVYTLLALYPTPEGAEFKTWFLQIREYLYQVAKDGCLPGYTLQ